MRIFIYGMQSSGASLFTFWMAQSTNRIAIIDLFHQYQAPDLSDDTSKEVVLKAVITESNLYENHIAQFKPDVKILFLRNEKDNYDSLKGKWYANKSGTIDNKFKILNDYIKKPYLFDFFINYEDFVTKNNSILENLKTISDSSFYKFRRSKKDILNFNIENSNWCKENHMKKWNLGNINFDKGMLRKNIFL